jgi:uncharacterized protein
LTREERYLEVIGYWWAKARDSLDSAQREFEAGANSFVMNRLYYSAFYGVCAALLERHQSFKKHSGVRAAFHRQFIKSGQLDIKWGRFYDRLFEDRQEGDYVVFVSFESDYVQFQLQQCSEFLKALRECQKTWRHA